MSRIFDYDDGDFIHSMSDTMGMDFDGNFMMRMSDNMAMDMDSGEMHFVSFGMKMMNKHKMKDTGEQSSPVFCLIMCHFNIATFSVIYFLKYFFHIIRYKYV